MPKTNSKMSPKPRGGVEGFPEDSVTMESDAKPSLKNLTEPNYGRPGNKQNPILKSLGAPHIGSFNFMLEPGLSMAVADLAPMEFRLENGRRVSLTITDCRIEKPSVPAGTMNVTDNRVWPTEARQRGSSYKGQCRIRMTYSLDGIVQNSLEKSLGAIPIMLRSDACHLNGKIYFIRFPSIFPTSMPSFATKIISFQKMGRSLRSSIFLL